MRRDNAPSDFETGEAFAINLDAGDPLRTYRDRFHCPKNDNGDPLVYLCGHSLGLQPKSASQFIEQELNDWATLGVDAHFHGRNPWYSYHELFRESVARLVGARPGETVVMNSLTVNLHLMLATFYQPTERRFQILVDEPQFPSDRYAVETHLRHRGLDPKHALRTIKPRDGEYTLRMEDIEAYLHEHGESIALVLFNGVNYVTGQLFDMPRLTQWAKQHGCIVGFDLAHAAGNVPMRLHDWGADFAVWCHYKYVNGGPGTVGGCFVHETHGHNTDLPRLAGWWGADPATRFQKHDTFQPQPGADGWQLSNPPIFALVPLRASLELFDEVGMEALREKSVRLTGYLEFLLRDNVSDIVRIITPPESAHRGCQLSLMFPGNARKLRDRLQQQGIVTDFRAPNVIRVAPVPLYNSYRDVWRFVQAVAELDLYKS